MRAYTLTHLSDPALLAGLSTLVTRERANTAVLLAHLAEVDERKLYLPAGYASMFAYCVGDLHFSEDVAAKRIQAARAARKFPALFAAVADGRLHVTGVRLLAPHLTPENFDELLAAATHRGKAAIELLVARRLEAVAPDLDFVALAAAPDLGPRSADLRPPVDSDAGPSPASCGQHAPGHVGAARSPEAAALSPGIRIPLRIPLTELTHLKLKHAQALLSHAIPSGDVAEVIDRALDALILQLERRRFAAASHPRLARTDSSRPRQVPAHVRRSVWKRDEGRCTFVGNTGHRCGEVRFLEFDHVEPVARGGRATIDGMRLRCRAHNQYEAERLFGAGFMQEKRRMAASTRAVRKREAGVRADRTHEEAGPDREPSGRLASSPAPAPEPPDQTRSI